MPPVSGAEMRGRRRVFAASDEEASAPPPFPSSPTLSAPNQKAAKNAGIGGGRGPPSFITRNLPLILGAQVFLITFLLLDPFGLHRRHLVLDTKPITLETTKPFLNLADLETLTDRVAVNSTVILLICPTGYVDFVQNWLLITEAHTKLDGKFLVLAEDEDTYNLLNSTFSTNTILKLDVQDPTVDLASCSSPNPLAVASLLAAHRKVAYTREIMNTGKHVFMCDVTAVLRQSPFPFFVQNDMYVTLGDVSEKGGDQLLGDFPSQTIMRLQAPLPRGVGKLPPLSDETLFFVNNVGSWVVLDYWAVVIEAAIQKECNSQVSNQEGGDSYIIGASTSTFRQGVHNAIHLSPPPLIGLMPPGQFPPPGVFFEDESWRALIEKDTVVIRTKIGAKNREQIQDRLRQVGLWKVT